MLDDIDLIAHGAPGLPLLLDTLLQLRAVLLRDGGLVEHVLQHWQMYLVSLIILTHPHQRNYNIFTLREVVECVRGPHVRRVVHDRAHHLLQPGRPRLNIFFVFCVL